MTANVGALLPGVEVLIDTTSSNPRLDYTRGDRATVVRVDSDGHVTCRLHRNGHLYAFQPHALLLIPPGGAVAQ